MNKEVIKELGEVYGKNKAKKMIKKILSIKKKHPKIVFSFIFDEEGNVSAIPKEAKNESVQISKK